MSLTVHHLSPLRWAAKHHGRLARLMDWREQRRDRPVRDQLQRELTAAFAQNPEIPLFYHLQLETVSVCNNDCAFCPVNVHVDPRPTLYAGQPLIDKVAAELKALDFAGRISLFNNNEPLVDKRLPAITRQFREACPKAEINILTNGKLITWDLVKQLAEAGMNHIGINNYDDDNAFIPPVAAFLEEWEARPINAIRVVVTVRKKTIVLSNRAGDAPNKSQSIESRPWFCQFPFEQISINPLGEISLCCNDALYRHKLGNVLDPDQTLERIWTSPAYADVRRTLAQGRRQDIALCAGCDNSGTSGLVLADHYVVEQRQHQRPRLLRFKTATH